MRQNSTVNFKDLAAFCRQLNMVVRSNISLAEGVGIVADQTQNQKLKNALLKVNQDMERGKPFNIAISEQQKVFPSYLLNMLKLGETSGNLDKVTEELSAYYDKENYFRSKLRSAAIYPLILLVLMTGVILLLLIKVLPTFQAILYSLGGELPPLTKALLALGFFLGHFFIIILILLIILIIFCRYYFHTSRGRYLIDKLRLTLPAIGRLNQFILTSRFSRSVSILLKSGAPLLIAIDNVIPLMDNVYLAEKLKLAQEKIAKEKLDFAKAIESIEIFPPLFIKMAAIGEKTGNLDMILEKSAQTFSDEASDTLERLSVTIEPALIIILSVIVTIILLSVILPMINIISNIG